MPAKRSAGATHRFQPFQPSSGLFGKVDQPKQKRFFPNKTNKKKTNPTNQKRLVPKEHDHRNLKNLFTVQRVTEVLFLRGTTWRSRVVVN